MRLSDEDRERLKSVIGVMLDERDLQKGERFSYAGAVRFACRRYLETREAGR